MVFCNQSFSFHYCFYLKAEKFTVVRIGNVSVSVYCSWLVVQVAHCLQQFSLDPALICQLHLWRRFIFSCKLKAVTGNFLLDFKCQIPIVIDMTDKRRTR